eukprot:2802197-Prymnesium_polylepis.1
MGRIDTSRWAPLAQQKGGLCRAELLDPVLQISITWLVAAKVEYVAASSLLMQSQHLRSECFPPWLETTSQHRDACNRFANHRRSWHWCIVVGSRTSRSRAGDGISDTRRWR